MTVVEIEIQLTPEDIAAAEGDIQQAVQNLIGHTGAVVLEVVDS